MAENITNRPNGHIGIPGYLGVFAVLVVGTILTYLVATVDLDRIFPGANTLVALLIAFTKMACVMLFFMHVRWSPRLIWLAAVGELFLAGDHVLVHDAGLSDTRTGVFSAVRLDYA